MYKRQLLFSADGRERFGNGGQYQINKLFVIWTAGQTRSDGFTDRGAGRKQRVPVKQIAHFLFLLDLQQFQFADDMKELSGKADVSLVLSLIHI